MKNIDYMPTSTDIFQIVDKETRRERRFNAFESPIIRVMIEGKYEPVFIDTGAPFSIFNPLKDENKRTQDRILKAGIPTGSQRNCVFKGVGGARHSKG